jgi:hypothetical protein
MSAFGRKADIIISERARRRVVQEPEKGDEPRRGHDTCRNNEGCLLDIRRQWQAGDVANGDRLGAGSHTVTPNAWNVPLPAATGHARPS